MSKHLNKIALAVVDLDAYVDVRFHWHKLLMLVLVLALVLASLVKTRLYAV